MSQEFGPVSAAPQTRPGRGLPPALALPLTGNTGPGERGQGQAGREWRNEPQQILWAPRHGPAEAGGGPQPHPASGKSATFPRCPQIPQIEYVAGKNFCRAGAGRAVPAGPRLLQIATPIPVSAPAGSGCAPRKGSSVPQAGGRGPRAPPPRRPTPAQHTLRAASPWVFGFKKYKAFRNNASPRPTETPARRLEYSPDGHTGQAAGVRGLPHFAAGPRVAPRPVQGRGGLETAHRRRRRRLHPRGRSCALPSRPPAAGLRVLAAAGRHEAGAAPAPPAGKPGLLAPPACRRRSSLPGLPASAACGLAHAGPPGARPACTFFRSLQCKFPVPPAAAG